MRDRRRALAALSVTGAIQGIAQCEPVNANWCLAMLKRSGQS